MTKLERFQRGLAALVGLLVASRVLYGVFRDPDPRYHNPLSILLRVVVGGLVSFLIARRAVGKKLEPISWGVFAMLFTDGFERATSLQAMSSTAVCVTLALVGGLIELRLARAAQKGPFPRPESG